MMLPPLGLVLAMMIGASLGVFGAGGSIVTVPALVYVVGLGVQEATATSLLVVGLVAVAGTALRWQTVRPRAGAMLGASGVFGALPGAWLNHQVPPAVILVGLASTLLLSGAGLLRSDETAATPTAEHPAMALLGGLGVGLATGFFGVGGGFLIVPALVLLLGLEMPQAVATSLLVIALNSAAGLVAHARYGTIEWQLGLEFAAVALLGAGMATPLARRLHPRGVQHAFALVLLVLGTGMLIQGVIGWWT
jgi:uncharacterized membrane protein YfcA